jgi:hypothetical protein
MSDYSEEAIAAMLERMSNAAAKDFSDNGDVGSAAHCDQLAAKYRDSAKRKN